MRKLRSDLLRVLEGVAQLLGVPDKGPPSCTWMADFLKEAQQETRSTEETNETFKMAHGPEGIPK